MLLSCEAALERQGWADSPELVRFSAGPDYRPNERKQTVTHFTTEKLNKICYEMSNIEIHKTLFEHACKCGTRFG